METSLILLRGEYPGFSRVVAGNLRFLSSCEGPLGIPLQSVQGPRSLYSIEAGTSEFLYSAEMDLGFPMDFQEGSQGSPRIETRKTTFLSSCKSSVRLSDNFPDLFLGPRAHPGLFLTHSVLGQPCIESCLWEVPGHKLHVIPAPG